MAFYEQLDALLGQKLPTVAELFGRDYRSLERSRTVESSAINEEPHQESTEANARRKPEIPDTTPALELFEYQIRRFLSADLQNPGRLPMHWDYLSPNELRIATLPLVQALEAAETGCDDNPLITIHAAARLVSLFAGLSLRDCYGLPITRKGSLHIDLKFGVIRRWALAAAPRTIHQDRLRTHGHWWRTPVPPQIIAVLQTFAKKFPTAQTLGSLMLSAGLTPELGFQLLNKHWHSSHRPEDARYSNSLAPVLLALEVHPAIAARTTGNLSLTPLADHYYLRLPTIDVHTAIEKFCAWVGLTAPARSTKAKWIGSPKYMSQDELSRWIDIVQNKTELAREEIHAKSSLSASIQFHNIYTLAVMTQLIWAVGGRGTAADRITVERMLIDPELVILSDKQTDRYALERLVPLTAALSQTRLHYIEHLRAMSALLARHRHTYAEVLGKLVLGECPQWSAFHMIKSDANCHRSRGARSNDLFTFARQILEEQGVKYQTGDFNRPRHFWSTHLVRLGTSQLLIDFILGRHQKGNEPLGFFSGTSANELCKSAKSTLEYFHATLGLRPLIGLGRTASRFLRLPAQNHFRPNPLPNRYLNHKINQAEQITPDHFVQSQDPPVGPQTLAAAAYLTNIACAYAAAGWATKYPHGALLFCLVVFDLTLTGTELQSLYISSFGHIIHVENLIVLESRIEEKVQCQRLASRWTIDILALVHRVHPSGPDWSAASAELHQLLLHLDPKWIDQSPMASIEVLCAHATHWAALHLPPGTQFVALHKGPCIPAAGLHRVLNKTPEVGQPSVKSETNIERARSRYPDWEPILKIVRHWAVKDLPLGESEARRLGCTQALQLWRDTNLHDEFEGLFVELLIADLSLTPPYRTLRTSVLQDYAVGYSRYFDKMRREGSPELDGETVNEAYFLMGGNSANKNRSIAARWQLLHIAAFLHSRGLWAPSGFLKSRGKRDNRLPRAPVYLTLEEFEEIQYQLSRRFKNLAGTYATAGLRLRLARSSPSRVSELRFLRPLDLDSVSNCIHITTSGHDHLKTKYSRSSVEVPKALMGELHAERLLRESFSTSYQSFLFADGHVEGTFDIFDDVTDTIHDVARALTGNHRFRWHDLRAAAITDLCCRLPDVFKAVTKSSGDHLTPSALWPDLTEKHRRFAWAARQARHASALTTLRHYNVGGVLDLHFHLRHAWSQLQPSTTYVSAVTGEKAHTLRVRLARWRRAGKATSHQTLTTLLENFKTNALSSKGAFSTSVSPGTPFGDIEEKSSQGVRIAEAILLTGCGRNFRLASSATFVHEDLLIARWKAISKVARNLHIKMKPLGGLRLLDSTLRSSSTYQRVIRELAHIFDELSPGNSAALDFVTSIDSAAIGLVARTPEDWTSLARLMKSLSSIGVYTWVQLQEGSVLATHPAILQAVRSGDVLLHPRAHRSQDFAHLRFALRSISGSPDKSSINKLIVSSEPSTPSPRSTAILGRLVSLGLLLSITKSQ